MMKKSWTTILTALAALALGIAAAAADEAFEPMRYEAQNVRAVRIDVRDRRVEVLPSEDGTLRIEAFESGKERYGLSVDEGGNLVMTLDTSAKTWMDFIGGKPEAGVRTITLRLPEGGLDELAIATTNEDIVLSPLRMEQEAALVNNGGSIRFEGLDAGSAIRLEAKNGDIVGSVAGGWDDYAIACNIKKGRSNLPQSKPEGAKTLTVVCNNGEVEVRLYHAGNGAGDM